MSDAETASGTPDAGAGAATSARHSVGVEANAPGAHEQGSVPLSVPNIGELERRYVLEAVESGFVSSVGPFVSEFEERFAEYVGAGYAVATSSGTAALHVALILLGVERDDEVMVSDFTFVGSINPIAYLGAGAVLVDSDASWDLDPDLVEGELQRRVDAGEPLPKVLEVVHVLGQPADMGRLAEICERFGVAVLEDAAESLGATWTTGELAGRHTGTVGRIGCYSFNGNKVATTGGGGMLVTDDEALARRAKHLTTQAKVPDIGYLHDEVGYNYRLTNIAAGLGLAQLERLPGFLEAKHRIARRYDEAFAELPLTLPPRIEGTESNDWLYSVLVPEDKGGRDAFLAHLKSHQVQGRALWRPLHAQPPFAGSTVLGGDVGDDLFARGVSLPCSTDLTEADQERVVDAVLTFFD